MNKLDKSLYNYHLVILQKEFQDRKIKNNGYSLRQFAKKLGMSPSWLSDVLKEKKFISIPAAEAIASRLSLVGLSRKKFLLCCLICQTKNKKVLEKALTDYADLESNPKEIKIFDKDNLVTLETWPQFAIMELITFKEFDHTMDWLAKKLRTTTSEVEKHLKKLTELGWVTHEDHKYRPSFQYCESIHDTSSINIKKYHESILNKAKEALTEQDVSMREFQSLIMGSNISSEKLKKAKSEIRSFISKFNDKFADEKDKNCVYQLSIQFFKLT